MLSRAPGAPAVLSGSTFGGALGYATTTTTTREEKVLLETLLNCANEHLFLAVQRFLL